MAGAEAGGEGPVLALDVVDDGGARPGQQRGHDEADALAGTRGREAQNVLGAVMAEIRPIQLTKHDAVWPEQAGRLHFGRRRPPGGTIGLDVLRFARWPDGHTDGDRDRDESARCRDARALDEHRRGVGVLGIPPPEKGRGKIDRHAGRQLEPGLSQFRLESESPRRPLCRGPDRDKHDQTDDDNLAP